MRLTLALSFLLAACSGGAVIVDPPPDAATTVPDSGQPSDGGPAADAGAVPDAGAPDAGTPDAGTPDAGPPDAGTPDAGLADAGAPDSGTPVDLCPAAEKICVGHNQRRYCGMTAAGLRWLAQTCAAGSGCLNGDCVAGACSDECNLGESDGGKTCGLYEITTNTWPAINAATSLHDRARDYNRWLRRDGMAAGGVGSVKYADPPAYTQLEFMDGIGDSALWTGTYLAAEALRLQATGAPDARANVKALVSILHLWFGVSGSPGNLARYAVPSGKVMPFQIGDLDCTNARVHCAVPHLGTSYDYIGHVSRDQYQGVVLGFALAYDALGSEDAAVKDVIRADIVTLVKELMKERQVQLSIKFNGTRLPTTTASARFIVLSPAEMLNGAIDLQFSLTSGGDGEMWGFQEFTPDLADLVREVPGLSWVPAIERPSSAIMLASFFQVGLHLTAGDPRFAADHAAMLAYYTGHTGKGGNISDWLTIAKKWAAGTGCNQSYYANNITMEPLYNLARLESDPARRAEIHNTLFTTRMWPAFAPTKNPFFSYIYAGTVSGVASAVTNSALTQLSQFPAPPRVQVPVDLRTDARYPHDLSCPDQVDHSTAVDVRDRVVSDFLWQRDPWRLYDPGDLSRTHPGVDYLVAYWLGRRHSFIADDTAGRCLAMH